MHAAHALPLLLAQAESTQFKFLYVLGILLGTIVVPFVVGRVIAGRLRLPGYGWKIGLILATVALSGVIVARTWNPEERRFEFKLGVDLKGGVILIYEVDENAPLPGEQLADSVSSDARFSMSALNEALRRRINPSGTKEIVIRPYGERQVEIIIPEVDQREVELIKRDISTAGVLQFRIVANSRDHAETMALARVMAGDPLEKRGRMVRDADGAPLGLWARVAHEQVEVDGIRPFKVPVAGRFVRNASTGDIIEVPQMGGETDDRERYLETRHLLDQDIREIDVLMAVDDPYDVTGAHLGAVGRGTDEFLNPCIMFNLQGEGVRRFAGLTSDYGPQSDGFERQLGILLDNELLSAPNIHEPITEGLGRITGQFTPEEVDFLVNILQAGSLPVVLNKTPISENRIDPLLGQETIRQGKYAIGISLAMVLVFILVYYRFAGLVACLALVTNLLLIMALMVLIKASITLPGLAGLVLTVGMSVDANVLIFERIREELTRGSALRMAIRNGFSRATRTIVDANLTTLITAFVLYGIGTDQIRGFAVTLILGILMSMYTAIFCARVVFDVVERTRRVTRLNMSHLLGTTQIDFLGRRWIAGAFSLILITIGLVGIVARGADIFDIDFRGGTSVHVMFEEPIATDVVRQGLQEAVPEVRFTVTAMNSSGSGASQNIFKVDSALPEVEELQQVIRAAFPGRLATYSFDYTVASVDAPDQQDAAASRSATDPPGESDDDNTGAGGDLDRATGAEGATESGTEGAASDQTGAVWPPLPLSALAQAELPGSPDDETPTESPAESTTPAETETQVPTGEAGADSPETAADAQQPPDAGRSAAAEYAELMLTFEQPINAETLSTEIQDAAEQLDLAVTDPELINTNWDGVSSNAFEQWTVRLGATDAQAKQLLEYLKAKFSDTPVWPSSNKIGSQVADRMQNKALAALATSLLGIVVYIWIRFQRVIFGLAAVVALVHDVLVTLGAIAVSSWVAVDFLLLEEFKISLPIVAALLTIIGYSLNDTIVVFDRIREVRGKSLELTQDMVNTSINQTLNRTLLTSLTTLVVVVILYAFGGEGIHGFAFALVVGVTVGTYSSIFVASPILLWMTSSNRPAKGRSAAA